jgi:TnpA family transposase
VLPPRTASDHRKVSLAPAQFVRPMADEIGFDNWHTASIPPSGEAAYVIDGLLYHEADLSIPVHHTDGGGVSDHVFALAHLLGFRFVPRIPNLADRKLYAFGPASTWSALAPFIGGRPDEKLITAQWDDVLRLAASVRTGTVSASLMLKRLGAYPRQNGLALALREIGRIERTLHALIMWNTTGKRKIRIRGGSCVSRPDRTGALSGATAASNKGLGQETLQNV